MERNLVKKKKKYTKQNKSRKTKSGVGLLRWVKVGMFSSGSQGD